jgi:hypothetical protein
MTLRIEYLAAKAPSHSIAACGSRYGGSPSKSFSHHMYTSDAICVPYRWPSRSTAQNAALGSAPLIPMLMNCCSRVSRCRCEAMVSPSLMMAPAATLSPEMMTFDGRSVAGSVVRSSNELVA